MDNNLILTNEEIEFINNYKLLFVTNKMQDKYKGKLNYRLFEHKIIQKIATLYYQSSFLADLQYNLILMDILISHSKNHNIPLETLIKFKSKKSNMFKNEEIYDKIAEYYDKRLNTKKLELRQESKFNVDNEEKIRLILLDKIDEFQACDTNDEITIIDLMVDFKEWVLLNRSKNKDKLPKLNYMEVYVLSKYYFTNIYKGEIKI